MHEAAQAAFAKKLGITVSHLSDIENGRKGVSPERAVKFARILGLSEKQLKIPAVTLRKIIQEYTREAGVRSLERNLANVCRKVASQVVKEEVESVRLQPNLVPKFLGPPKIVRENEVKGPQVGIVMGLAWTETGGETLSIEVNTMPGKGKLQLTGQLGDVMKESAHAALSYVRANCEKFGISKDFLEKSDIHIHIPAGAMPKDGPSAGVTMFTALVSLLTGIRVRHDVAMTGEISLRGRVLPIGGLKEKVLAAHRAGIKRIVLPERNVPDLEEVPAEVKGDLEFIAASKMEQVLDAALEEKPTPKPEGTAAAPSTN